MPTIAVLAAQRNGHHPNPGVRAVEAAGGKPIMAEASVGPDVLDEAGGLLVSDAGFDHEGPDAGALALLEAALAVDMPTLLTGKGMYLLNATFGGGEPSSIEGGTAMGSVSAGNEKATAPGREARRQIYLSPGSKMAAIIGSAGMFRLQSGAWSCRMALREPQRSGRLMSIAYQLDDGVIEGLESKEHSWVIGLQFLPERAEEVPASFNSLLLGLVERADDFGSTGENRT
ncbi:MAG: gamma-glutamyl-gamma-aminobutyrate hydrolase family protein [Chloroflexota bacterium]|nr:gamma-glutamyl-gamma-aminobutyrate hydrolase family protein [Chloroflexota bacterium]